MASRKTKAACLGTTSAKTRISSPTDMAVTVSTQGCPVALAMRAERLEHRTVPMFVPTRVAVR